MTYPSSIVTEFMMMQFVILTLSFMLHMLPMMECLIDVFSPTCVDDPMMLSDPTYGRKEQKLAKVSGALR